MKPTPPNATAWQPTISSSCGKRRFESHESARRAHRHASFRVRTYRCEVCGGLHVTHQEIDRGYVPDDDEEW